MLENAIFYYIIGKSVIRAFQQYAEHPISHYGSRYEALKIIALSSFFGFSLT